MSCRSAIQRCLHAHARSPKREQFCCPMVQWRDSSFRRSSYRFHRSFPFHKGKPITIPPMKRSLTLPPGRPLCRQQLKRTFVRSFRRSYGRSQCSRPGPRAVDEKSHSTEFGGRRATKTNKGTDMQNRTFEPTRRAAFRSQRWTQQ